MASNRERALGAAIELLGTGGLRALTHARVDDRAGLPKGSTSNYFRTRAALLGGVVEWMVRQESPAVATALDATSAADFVDELCRLFEFMTGPNRTMTAARMVLWLEASHDPSLRQSLLRGRTVMAALVVPALARLGARDPQAAASALAACFEGLYMNRIARHADTDPRPVFEVVIRGALA
jgi:DNA-binding transcriptional regulator YbjK